MSLPRPSTAQEREEVVAVMRANRRAGRPIYTATGKFGRSEGTLRGWLAQADAADKMDGIREKTEAKASWPKPFWEL